MSVTNWGLSQRGSNPGTRHLSPPPSPGRRPLGSRPGKYDLRHRRDTPPRLAPPAQQPPVTWTDPQQGGVGGSAVPGPGLRGGMNSCTPGTLTEYGSFGDTVQHFKQQTIHKNIRRIPYGMLVGNNHHWQAVWSAKVLKVKLHMCPNTGVHSAYSVLKLIVDISRRGIPAPCLRVQECRSPPQRKCHIPDSPRGSAPGRRSAAAARPAPGDPATRRLVVIMAGLRPALQTPITRRIH